MNRTKEFMNIVKSTNFPQKEPKTSTTIYTTLFTDISEIRKLIDEIENIVLNDRLYESFTLTTKTDRIKMMLTDLRKRSSVQPEYSNDHEKECYTTILNIITSRTNEQALRVNSLLRKKNDKLAKTEKRRQSFSTVDEPDTEKSTALMIEEEQQSLGINRETVNIRNRERERITDQINEIGQIMEEIGLHVSLQEESLKRIDDLMNESNKVIDNSLYMLKDVLTRTMKSRSGMIKFFLFWIVLFIIFWFLRR